MAGIRHLLGLAAGEPITPERVDMVKMGTTVATNALLERRGERTALATTRGFRDVLRIAYQNRPRLFDLDIVLPDALYETVVEIDERIGAHGDIVVPFDAQAPRRRCAACSTPGVRALAIVLIHGYRYTAHERALADLAAPHRLHAGVGVARGVAADEDGVARRYDGSRRVPVADPAPLCRAGRARDAGREPAVHAEQRRG